jgi:DNA-binding MarR family transcriptional regulator
VTAPAAARSSAASTELSAAEYRALAEFRHALRVFLHFSEDAARAAGVTPAQHQLLLAVRGTADGDPDITDLAERLQLKHHSVVEALARATVAGLVQAEADPDDRRRQRIRLTDEGARILRELSVVHRDELRRFRDEMGDVLHELG